MSMSEKTERPCRACGGTGYRGLDDCSDCGCTGTITAVAARPFPDPTETLALIEQGRQEERAAMIAWLRDPVGRSWLGSMFADAFANMVERGEHVSRIRGQQ